MSLDQDVKVEIGDKEYSLILDTVALSRFEEWLNDKPTKFNISWMEWWQNILVTAGENKRELIFFPLRDGLYLLWCALQRYHKKEFRNVDAVAGIITNPMDVMGGTVCAALITCWNKHLPQPDEIKETETDTDKESEDIDEDPLSQSETGGT